MLSIALMLSIGFVLLLIAVAILLIQFDCAYG
jgi:hypothetical protein